MKRHETGGPTAGSSPAVGTVLIIIVLLLIFGVILFWMYSVKLLMIPESLSELLGIGEDDVEDSSQWNTGEFSGAVKSGKSDDYVKITFDVTCENLRAALLSEPEPEGIYQQVRVSYYDEGKAVTRSVVLKRWGKSFRIEKYKDDSMSELEALIISDGTSVYYLDEATGESRTLPRNADATAESEAGLPSINELLAILNNIQDGDTTDESSGDVRYNDLNLAMLHTDSGIVYYAAYNDDEFGLREEFYISLENRVIINHTTSDGDAAIYSCETVSFSTNPDFYSDPSDYKP